MTTTREREAACSCGQLKIRLSGDPQLVSSCHCLACQRRTGALFGSTSFWRKSQVLAIEGERRSWRRVADSGTGTHPSVLPDLRLDGVLGERGDARARERRRRHLCRPAVPGAGPHGVDREQARLARLSGEPPASPRESAVTASGGTVCGKQ